MILKYVKLENYRCFESVDFELNKNINLFIGNNSAGKTTILDGIANGLGSVYSYIPNVKGFTFKQYDIKQKQNFLAPYSKIYLETNDNLKWDKLKKKNNSKKTSLLLPQTIGTKILKNFINNNFIDNYSDTSVLPFFAYYGTSRAVLDIPLRRTGFKKVHNRFDGMGGSLNANSSFKSAFIWFYNKENEENRLQKEKRSFEIELNELATVRKAIGLMFPELLNPHIEVNPLRFMIEKDNEKLNIEQLSDGYKTMLGVIIDLSSRMAMVNPQLSNPLDCEAIVLIDEIDLHLHPSWQKRIIEDLKRTFPNTQFILTTHSPHIVTSVKPKELFVIDDFKIDNDVELTYGIPIQRALEDIMGISVSRNNNIQNMIDILWDKIKLKEIDKDFFALKKELENYIGTIDIDILSLNLAISRIENERKKC
jgi:predicted ATP-binding protein involved in virulence